MSDLYRDFIDQKADQIINSLGGTITPAPANAELYRDFLDRKFDDVINAIGNVKVKSFTYKGNGQNNNDIVFDSKPNIILSIERPPIISGGTATYSKVVNISWNIYTYLLIFFSGTPNLRLIPCSFNDNTLTINGSSPGEAFNVNNVEYTVYYI